MPWSIKMEDTMHNSMQNLPAELIVQIMHSMPYDVAETLGRTSRRFHGIFQKEYRELSYHWNNDRTILAVTRGKVYSRPPEEVPERLVLLGLNTLQLNRLQLKFNEIEKIEFFKCKISTKHVKMMVHKGLNECAFFECHVQVPLKQILPLLPHVEKFVFLNNNNGILLPKNISDLIRRWYKSDVKIRHLALGPLPLSVDCKCYAKALFTQCAFLPETILGISFQKNVSLEYKNFFCKTVDFYLNRFLES